MQPLPSRGASAFASRGLSVQLGKGVSHSTRVVGLSRIKGSQGDIWSRRGLRKPRLFPPPTPHLTRLCGGLPGRPHAALPYSPSLRALVPICHYLVLAVCCLSPKLIVSILGMCPQHPA